MKIPWLDTRSPIKWPLIALLLAFAGSRIAYWLLGVEFDTDPMNFYWQVIDPALLRSEFWRSILYLREQMPGFNLLLGAGLHLFDKHIALAFHALFILIGVILMVSLFLLLLRLHVTVSVAFVVTLLFIANPATVLYENWLFYEYPIAAIFALAALFCHRYLSTYQFQDGFALFACFTALGYMRVIFHLAWFVAMMIILAYMTRSHWRRTFACAIAPLLVLALPYVKNLVVFGTFSPGNDYFGGINLLSLAANGLSGNEIVSLKNRGIISNLYFVKDDPPSLERLVPIPPSTGIALLDQRVKSSGAPNNLGQWKIEVGRMARKDGIAIFRARPDAWIRSVRHNLRIYSLLADEGGFPFDGRSVCSRAFEESGGNTAQIQRLRGVYHRVLGAGLPGTKRPLFMIVVLVVVLAFGLTEVIHTGRQLRRVHPLAEDCTLSFCAISIFWLSAVVLLYTYTDQNRIMFEVSPLMSAVATVLAGRIWRKVRETVGPNDRTSHVG
jgi:hypothetical protein